MVTRLWKTVIFSAGAGALVGFSLGVAADYRGWWPDLEGRWRFRVFFGVGAGIALIVLSVVSPRL